MTNTTAFTVDDSILDRLGTSIGDRLQVDPRSQLLVTHLDTFDWRLWRDGSRLCVETTGGRRTLRWSQRDTTPYVLPFSGDVRFVRDLPDGFLRSSLEPVVGVRTLLPVGECRVERTTARIADGRGDTAVRIIFERIRPLDAAGKPADAVHHRLWLSSVAGHEKTGDGAHALLHEAGAAQTSASEDLELAAAARGRRPGDYRSRPQLRLKAGRRAGKALRVILGSLLETFRANIDGVLADLDVEFLHDLRVATRRSRAAVAQIKGVLPQEPATRLSNEFKWLAAVTGPCRDLDVFLLECEGFRQQLGDLAGELDPLQRHLESRRRREHRHVCSALRSARCREFVDTWTELVTTSANDGVDHPEADRPIGELAGKRILKAYKRAVKRGLNLAGDPPAQALHKLRIDAKKLRYLLEFFESLYGKKAIARLVKELKQLQDILGGHNDMAVQLRRLGEFADQLTAAGDAPASTMLAMGRIAAAMDERRQEYRRQFARSFADFANDESRDLYSRTFGGS
jgi:CHAD domain-containing protein